MDALIQKHPRTVRTLPAGGALVDASSFRSNGALIEATAVNSEVAFTDNFDYEQEIIEYCFGSVRKGNADPLKNIIRYIFR